jgi:hypothetical protein
MPVGYGEQHGVLCDNRLAAPHVTLEKPIHGKLPRHIGPYFPASAILIFGQLEGKAAADSRFNLCIRR